MNSDSIQEAINLYENEEYVKARILFSKFDTNVIAQYYLGAIYRMGLGMKENQKKAFTWFLKAAKQGHAESQFLVGCAYIEYLTFMNRETDLVKIDFNRFEERTKSDLSVWQDDLPYYELDGVGVVPNDLEGFYWIETSAKQGYANALIALGDLYDWGIGVEQDKGVMKDCYERAALCGSATAYRKLAFHSYVYDEDFPKTIELLLKAYHLGDLRVAYTIGKRYEKAESHYKNIQEAYKWYKIASDECNHFEALQKLGDFHMEGSIFEYNIKLAIDYYKKAIDGFDSSYDSGYCLVYEKLLELYNQGFREAVAEEDMIAYLICLADSNDMARDKLRTFYNEGKNIGDSYKIFFSLLSKAEEGDKLSRLKLGFNYLRDNPMDDIVKKNAFEWFMDDAVNGCMDSQYLISKIHFGRNNKVDYPFWLKKAADNGHIKAQLELALYYEYIGHEDSIKYLKIASESNVVAQIDIGYKYGHGEDVNIDYQEAYSNYQLAAANMKKINELSELKGINRIKFRYNAANDEAASLAREGDISALLYMGCLYQYGFEVKRNTSKAIYWYKKASELGSEEAKKQLRIIDEN